MNNTKFINNSYNNFWLFIESNLPNYSSRDDILHYDILFRYIDDDDVCDEDMKWIENDYKCDKDLIEKELIRLETKFINEITFR